MKRIKTVIYIDVLLLVNFLVAACLLLAAGLFAGRTCPLWRLGVGAGAASLATLVLFAPVLPFWVQLCYQAASAALVVLLSYGGAGVRIFCKLLVWYYLFNLLLAGVIAAYLVQSKTTYHGVQSNNLSVYLYISPAVLIGSVLGVYLALKCVVFCFSAPLEALPAQEITLVLQGAHIALSAYYDTGFALQDPFSDRQVLLLSQPSVWGQLPPMLQAALGDAQHTQYEVQGLRFLPCGTIAGQCLLPAICAEYAYHNATPQRRAENILVAFCQEPSFCNGCNALFGAGLATQLIQ